VLYRIVKVGDQRAADYVNSFKSHAELGLPPHGTELEHPQIYEGITVWDRREAAAKTARKWPKIGEFVAEIHVPGGTDARALRWGPRGHLTLWGDPLMLSGLTAEITAA